MKITFEIDTTYDRTCEVNKNDYRAAAALLLHLIGDLNDEETLAPKAPAAPIAPTGPTAATPIVNATSVGAPVVASVPPPPAIVGDLGNEDADPDTAKGRAAAIAKLPPEERVAPPLGVPPPPPVPVGTNYDEHEDTSNVLPFPVPPPPSLSVATAALTALTSSGVASAAGVPTVAFAAPNLATPSSPSGIDSAGMPYDARIHQKTGNKKKDGTWKLIKGINSAVVAAVTAELAARKGAVAPVSLPATQAQQSAGSVPMPPPPAVTAVTGVPTPPVTSSVPVPPVAAVGAISTFRELIEKITAATKANQITPQDVSRLCQNRGAPNLMQLNSMPELLPKVTADIEAVLAGFSVDMVIAGLA